VQLSAICAIAKFLFSTFLYNTVKITSLKYAYFIFRTCRKYAAVVVVGQYGWFTDQPHPLDKHPYVITPFLAALPGTLTLGLNRIKSTSQC